MKRAELVKLVEDSASKAATPIPMRDKILAAVSDPSVTKVARGDWRRYISDGEWCFCPAALAGLATPTGPKDDLEALECAAVERFASHFDDLSRDREHGHEFIEVE